MKTRIKFIVSRIEMDIDTIANTINGMPYSESRGIGITSSNLGDSSFSATFIEKRKIFEQIDYPSGEIEQFERIKYLYINFEIINLNDFSYLIKVVNPPASLRSFINHLGKVLASLSIEKYQFDLKKFYKTIKDNRLISCKITSLKASSVPFSDKSVAKLEVASENDAYRELKIVYGERKYKLDRLVFSLLSDQGESFLNITSSGAASFNNDNHQNIVIQAFVQSISF